MKKLKNIILSALVLFGIVSCNSSNNNKNDTLRLLSFNVVEQQEIKSVGLKPIMNIQKVKGDDTVMVSTSDFETGITLIADIYNENRYSFADCALYFSSIDETHVYNEGHGAYQCASTTSSTKDENGKTLWHTLLEINIEPEILDLATRDETFIKIDEIRFHDNDTNIKNKAEVSETINKITFKASENDFFYEDDKYQYIVNTSNLTAKISAMKLSEADSGMDKTIVIPGELLLKGKTYKIKEVTFRTVGVDYRYGCSPIIRSDWVDDNKPHPQTDIYCSIGKLVISENIEEINGVTFPFLICDEITLPSTLKVIDSRLNKNEWWHFTTFDVVGEMTLVFPENFESLRTEVMGQYGENYNDKLVYKFLSTKAKFTEESFSSEEHIFIYWPGEILDEWKEYPWVSRVRTYKIK